MRVAEIRSCVRVISEVTNIYGSAIPRGYYRILPEGSKRNIRKEAKSSIMSFDIAVISRNIRDTFANVV
jgi:hypothetical protein